MRTGTSRRPSGKSTWMWPKSASSRTPGSWASGMKVSWRLRRGLPAERRGRAVAPRGGGSDAGVVGQRDEGLLAATAVLADVTADLVVAARVGVLVAQAAEDLHGGVPLLGRGVRVSGEEGVDGPVKGAQHRRRGRLGARVRG